MLEELNDKQKEAVLYNDGPLLIIAGAGAGKTKTLTTKIAYLIDHEKVSPYNILAITFTNKAAKEMKDRLFSLIGDVLPESIKNEINGIVVASRKDFNKLEIWFKNWSIEKNNIIEKHIRDLLQMPPEVTLEFKQFFPEETETPKK